MVAHEESTVGAVRRPALFAGHRVALRIPFLTANSAIEGARRSGDSATFVASGLLAVLFGLRCALAVRLPLSFDEAYYWLWSKHLALGYYEHPASIALAIRAGTSFFGDTEWGVRAIPVLLSVVASAAVWRSAALLLSSQRAGAIACLLFNSTLMVSAESMGATPDSLLIASAALLLWAVAKLQMSGDGRLWLAAGAAAGLAISAKYTGFFLCGSLVLWLLANPGARRWLRTAWPYAGALLAILFFVPTAYWNATHGFASFAFQFGRIGKLGAGHIGEFVGGQLALASPFILVLAGLGLVRNPVVADDGPPLGFASAILWPALLYFAFHALHDRVQANWPSFAYPALALLAAQAFARNGKGAVERLALVLALPIAFLILGVAYAQAFFGVLPIGKGDPIARMMGVGFSAVAKQIDSEAARINAHAIITTNYSMTSWLAFYARTPADILQVGDERRFLSSPRASSGSLAGTLLYVTASPDRELPGVLEHFSGATLLEKLNRMRNGEAVSSIYLYRISGFHGSALGRVPWPGRAWVGPPG